MGFRVRFPGVRVLLSSLEPLGVAMARVLNEILLFTCMAAFVTGVVIAAASLIG
jgi:hypothetical protein